MPKLLSDKPIVFASKSEVLAEYGGVILGKLPSYAPTQFAFTTASGETVTDENRRIYPGSILANDLKHRELIREFVVNELPDYIASLRQVLSAPDYAVQDINHIEFALRLRIIEDRVGYSLSPHRDSPDTLFSFIYHLHKNNSKTSLYEIKRSYTVRRPVSVDTVFEVSRKLISMNHETAQLIWKKNQFDGSHSCWLDSGYFFQCKFTDGQLVIKEFKETTLDLGDNNLYGIHNVLPGSTITSSKYIEINNTYYHGVRPNTEGARRLIIIDFLSRRPGQPKLDPDVVCADINSFYMFFKLPTTMYFRGLLK